MIEVFSTNISNANQAKELEKSILTPYPDLQINFDLEDCDRILRIAYENELDRGEIEAISDQLGIQIKRLE